MSSLRRSSGQQRGVSELLVAVTCLSLCSCAPGCAPTPANELAPKVLLVGIDGADPDLIELLVDQGRLPNLSSLAEVGFHGRLESREPLLSPLLWTSIATGRPPQEHGILDFVEVARDGAVVPIGSGRREVPALWNMIGGFGLESGVIGWYATHPAEAIEGWMVSDRLGHHQVKTGELDSSAVWPPGLLAWHQDEQHRDELESLDRPDVRIEATRREFLSDPRTALSEDATQRLIELARIHATSERYTDLAIELTKRHPTDLLMVYYEQIDACSHLFMEDAEFGPDQTSESPLSRVVQHCYVYQDRLLGRLLELTDENTLVLVVSDHGFKSGVKRPRTSGRVRGGKAAFWHRPEGVLLGRRSDRRRDRETDRSLVPSHGKQDRVIEGATVLDVVPTVLARLGVAIDRGLPGKVLEDVAGVDVPERRQVEYAFERSSERAPSASASDREKLERLAALGYLEPLTETSVELPALEDGTTVAALFNAGLANAFDGDRAAAVALYRQVLELSPTHVDAMLALAREEVDRGSLDQALDLLSKARSLRPQDSSVHLLYAAWALAAERLELAATSLEAARAIDDRVPMLYLLSARLENRRSRSADARSELARGIELADEGLLAELLLYDARIAIESGELEDAVASIERARVLVGEPGVAAARGELELARGHWLQAGALLEVASETNPLDPLIARRLGQALGAMGKFQAAETAFRRSLQLATSPLDRAGAYGDLSLLFQKTGDEGAASRVLAQATSELPGHAGLWGMLGAAHGRAGRYDEAIAAYRESVRLEPTTLGLNTLAALLAGERDDVEGAVRLWQRSLELDPDQPTVRQSLERVSG